METKKNIELVAACPECRYTFPDLKIGDKTPIHQIFDRKINCSGWGKELIGAQVNSVMPNPRPLAH